VPGAKRADVPEAASISFGPESGTFSLNPRGFGFITLHDNAAVGDKDSDIFVGSKLIEGNELLDGDEVEVTWRGESPKFTANSITRVEHRRINVLGVLVRRGNRWSVRVDPWVGVGERFVVSFADGVSGVAGSVVSGSLVGEALYIDHSYGAADSLLALRARALVRSRVADFVSPDVAPGERAASVGTRTRADLRGLYTFTIDGVESRDLDDALSVVESGGGDITLYVHIADVAERVAEGSPEDVAARLLGTSVYLPGAVVTMLPEEISFSECSLVPHSDKLTMTVEMVINPEGDITDSRIYESIINSDQRLSYAEVARALDVNMSRGPSAEKWVGAIELAHVSATRLGAARAARGGLSGPRVDRLGVEVTSSGLVRSEDDGARVAHDLIEEAMVAANEVVAEKLVGIGKGIFRIHETPGPEAAEAVGEFARALGVHTVLGGSLSPRALSSLERQLSERGVSENLWEALIGELGRAAYVPEPGYHFGLASNAYTHFTSPIRRYCDLSVHRILKSALFGENEPDVEPGDLCEGLNEATSRAAKAERYAQNLFELKWWSERFGVGSEVEAKVLRVSKRGALVALDGSEIRDWAEPSGKGRVFVAEDEKSVTQGPVTWSVGDSVRVNVGAVDLESGNVALVAIR
jgi:ribonuclease R